MKNHLECDRYYLRSDFDSFNFYTYKGERTFTMR